jgi:Ser/Thr protein kinase RdoA (MazF antagonist)
MDSGRVVHTTLSARAAADFAYAAFDIRPPQSVRLASRGFNDVYEIDGLYLRIGRCGRRSVADAEAEARALDELASAGAPVAAPRRGRDGCFAQAFALAEGERSVLLFDAAPGVQPVDRAEHAYAQGAALARVHAMTLSQATVDRMRRLDLAFLVDRSVDLVASQLPHRADLVGHLRGIAIGIRAHLPHGLSVGLCHGDCHGWNAAIEHGEAILFDFDECGVGPQAYDIATFLWGCTQVSPDRRVPLWPRFLAGYSSLRRLAAADVAALDLFFIVRELWFLGASAEGVAHWGNNWFTTSGIAPRIEHLRERCERLWAPRLLT